MSKKKKDSTIEGLQEEMLYIRDEIKAFGTSDYRRGYRNAIYRAIDIRKRELKIEAASARTSRTIAKSLGKVKR